MYDKRYMAMSRSHLEEYVWQIDRPTLVLSIRTKGDEVPEFLMGDLPDVAHVEFFEFNDECSDCEDAMTEEDATRMVDTVKKYWNSVDEIIVHCDAGQSRSAGCAAAIAKYYTGDDNEFFERKTPNMHCYYAVLEEFYNQEARETEQRENDAIFESLFEGES